MAGESAWELNVDTKVRQEKGNNNLEEESEKHNNKSKQIWQTGSGWTIAPNGKSDSTLYEQEDVLDYVQDFVFVAHDENGKIITSSLSYTPDKSRAFDVRTVDVGLILRSTKEFYKKDRKASGVIRKIVSLTSGRDISKEDKYLRDIITVTANARNVGLE